MGQKWDFGKIAPYPVWSPKAKSWVSRLGQLQPAPAGPGPPPGGPGQPAHPQPAVFFQLRSWTPPGGLKKQAAR